MRDAKVGDDVYGEDPNCDMGGSHISPFLGNFEGTFQEVLEHAANNVRGFYAWGGGGYVTPFKEKKESAPPTILDKKKNLKLQRKAKLKKLVKVDIDFLLENIDTLDKEAIREALLQLKTKME